MSKSPITTWEQRVGSNGSGAMGSNGEQWVSKTGQPELRYFSASHVCPNIRDVALIDGWNRHKVG
jgi:hypothetical protein